MNSENSIPTAIYHAALCAGKTMTVEGYTFYDEAKCNCHVAALAEKDREIAAFNEEREQDALTIGLIEADLEKLKDAQEEAIELLMKWESALTRITELGNVCENFELCRHPACHDNCSAVLIAREALKEPQ
jgi:hypothetical protein